MHEPRWVLNMATHAWGQCACRLGGVFAWAATPNIMLLFYPVPRSSFLHWMLGQNFQQLIKYHRCRGFGCFLVFGNYNSPFKFLPHASILGLHGI